MWCPRSTLNQSGGESAGPSTAFGANNAPNSAQDDRFVCCAVNFRDRTLVKADDVGQGTGDGDADAVGDLGGGGAVVLKRVDAHPVAGGAGELDDLGGRVAAQEAVLELDGVGLVGECADLHAHLPAGSTPGCTGGA